MKKLYITRRLPEIAKNLLSPHFEVTASDKNEVLSADQLLEVVRTHEVILSTIPDKLSKEVLEQAENLEVLSNYAVGLDNIDLAFAKEKGIAVYNTPGIVTASTADLTMALFLALTRNVFPAREFVREDKWKGWDPEFLLGDEFAGKVFGIVGFGRIGQAVAKRVLPFGCKVIYFNRSEVDLEGSELKRKVEAVTLDELYEQADYISLHVPLNEESKGMIDAEAIGKMTKKPILLNMARGPVVDSDDLGEALQNGKVRAAGLDVTEPEPISGEHVLCKLDNCIIVPHIGTSTIKCRHDMAKMAAENILKHYEISETAEVSDVSAKGH